ncbi:lysine--tRNA ligase [Candidatus Woesearchaeota archaeon]|nr:lysine--tRNA ligase [Candidatus Woesearchaeota archaeon]
MEDENRLIAERKRKLDEIKKMGINPYAYKYSATHHSEELQEKYSRLNAEEKTEDTVKVSGRLMILRRMGKVTFSHLQDSRGKIQLYFSKDDLGDGYDLVKLLDIGDIVGAEGMIFKTKTGEVTVLVKKIELLTKSLRPLPDKWHGLKDEDARYRMRYVDLIVNPEVKKTFAIREKLISEMRKFLASKGFLEVETPVLQPIYGGGLAKPFVTHHNALDRQMYLRISNELYLKRLLVGGYDKVFEFSRDFRNEGIDTRHNPEFTIMETMCAYADYLDSMAVVEEMISTLAVEILGKTKLNYQGTEIDLTPPWKKMSMMEAVLEFTGKDFKGIDLETARTYAKELRVEINNEMGVAGIMAAVFDEIVEERIIQPTFVMDHPVEISPLAKKKRGDEDFTERFELIIGGREYANVYSELNDPSVLRENFEKHKELREAGQDETHPVDDDFLCALEYGMPPASGIGIGMDRLAMLFANAGSIRDVIFFPILRKKE